MISRLSKTLPEIAKVTGLENEQSLHHLLTKSPGQPRNSESRLSLIFQGLKEKIFIIDETGDKKEGKTDYVNRQYLGS